MSRRTTKVKVEDAKLTLGQYIISRVRELEAQNATLGTMTDGIWQETIPGECWDTIRIGSVWEAKYVTLETLEREYRFYEEQFENRMMIIGVY